MTDTVDAPTRTAAVIGGSLGGLTAANLMRDDGWDVQVFERSPVRLDGRGAGIVVHPTTVQYLLDRLELTLDEISCSSSTIRHLGTDGSIIHEGPSTYRFTAWNTLYQALLAPMGDRYLLDHTVERVDLDGDRSKVVLTNGTTESFDLVVAADGFDSTVRKQFFGDVAPSYSGYVGWRGLVAESELSAETFELLADSITYCVLPGSHIVVYPIPTVEGEVAVGDRLINYVWYRNVSEGDELDRTMTDKDGNRRAVSMHPGAGDPDVIAEMREAAKELAPQLTEVIEKTAEPFIQVIVDIESTSMVSGNVALMGDGAFSARPHAAAGTAKAADDAWRLSEAVAGADHVPSALAAWERTQLEVGRKLVARARDIGERSQVHDTWVPGDPELAFGLHGPGY